jgi:hypothetical protein
MPALFNLGSNYEYIMSVWDKQRRGVATDDELLECIRSQCDPEKIIKGSIERGGSQLGFLGLIIEEIGRREIRDAAPIVVEYVAWPYDDDWWALIVPQSLTALCEIGDHTIVDELMRLTSGDVVTKKLLTLLKSTDTEPLELRLKEQPFCDEITDFRARLMSVLLDVASIEVTAFIHWADKTIGEMSGIPPIWLCDLSSTGIPKDIFDIGFEERLLCIAVLYGLQQISFIDAVESLIQDICEEYPVGKRALELVLSCPAFHDAIFVNNFRQEIELCLEDIHKKAPATTDIIKDLFV